MVTEERPKARLAAMALIMAAMAVWIWPVGLGLCMPIGGDVTRFALGLAGQVGPALRAGRIPLWNDLWGYGFPGLAESQMGFFYPPHLLLYGLCETEVAYTLSLLAHTLFGALGAFWAARKMGCSSPSAALAAVAWSGSGFFVIHLSHHWAVSTASWMPWAWGLTWLLLEGHGGARVALRLAAVFCLQVLPGHFQLAFITQVTCLALALFTWAAGCAGRRVRGRGLTLFLYALVMMLPLAAMQLWPTLELASASRAARGKEYLSGFAAAPVHFVSYLAPGLFHRSPLWRPVAWDPFRTSPEEHLAYIGLIPLFLAAGAVVRGWRRDRKVQILLGLALVTILLSIGDRTPGYEYLLRIPGFSFFRAPARWAVATQLALAILAGKGMDLIRGGAWARPGRALILFLAGVVVIVAGVVVGWEWLIFQTPASRQSGNRAPRSVWSLMAGPQGTDLSAARAAAKRKPQDALVEQGLLRQGIDPLSARLDRDRGAVYRDELGPSAVLVLALGSLAALSWNRRLFLGGLTLITVADLAYLAHRDRPVEFTRMGRLTDQSPVLAELAKIPRGTRVVSGQGNLLMAYGKGVLPPYRTLDRPALLSLTAAAQAPLGTIGEVREGEEAARKQRLLESLRITGAKVRLFEPMELLAGGWSPRDWPGVFRAYHDPALASWTYGQRFTRERPAAWSRFVIWRPDYETSKAWLLPAKGEEGADKPAGESLDVLESLRQARPLRMDFLSPERFRVHLEGDAPGRVVISELADPGWRAFWLRAGGKEPAVIEEVFREGGGGQGAWQAVDFPGGEDAVLEMRYQPRSVPWGLGISLAAWLAWGVSHFLLKPRSSAPALVLEQVASEGV